MFISGELKMTIRAQNKKVGSYIEINALLCNVPVFLLNYKTTLSIKGLVCWVKLSADDNLKYVFLFVFHNRGFANLHDMSDLFF